MPPEGSATIHPWRLARAGGTLAGRLPAAALERLRPLLVDDVGEVGYELRFHLDEDGRARVAGEVSATLRLVCQRCLEPFNHAVSAPVRLVVVEDADAGAGGDPGGGAGDASGRTSAEDVEPLVAGDRPVSLSTLVEDEVILALSAYPAHADGACRAPAGWAGGEPAPERRRPFAGLGKMWRDSS